MKLAEALMLRADYKIRGAQLRQRMESNAKVQEGETPSEDPVELLREFEQLAAEMVAIIKRINHTNANTPFPGGGTLTDALADRDGL